MAMPKCLSIPKIIAHFTVLAKLPNFCINEKDCDECNNISEHLNCDSLYMMNDCHGYALMENHSDQHGTLVPMAIMNGECEALSRATATWK